LNDVFDRLKGALDVISKIDGITFASSEQFGIVTSCPTNLGTAMRASVHMPLPYITRDGTDVKAKRICSLLGLSVRGVGGEHTAIGKDGTCDISPKARFAITEAQIMGALYNGIKELKVQERYHYEHIAIDKEKKAKQAVLLAKLKAEAGIPADRKMGRAPP
jgi:creatine kinase